MLPTRATGLLPVLHVVGGSALHFQSITTCQASQGTMHHLEPIACQSGRRNAGGIGLAVGVDTSVLEWATTASRPIGDRRGLERG